MRHSSPQHLVVAQPDAALCDAEVDHVVQEGFALGVPLGRGKCLSQHLLQQLQVRLLVKCLRRKGHTTIAAVTMFCTESSGIKNYACRSIHELMCRLLPLEVIMYGRRSSMRG